MYQNGIEFMHRKKEIMTGIGGCVHREGGGLFILEKRRLKKDKLTSSEQRGGAVENASQPSPFSLDATEEREFQWTAPGQSLFSDTGRLYDL